MLRSIPLQVQVKMIFHDLAQELSELTAGTVFLQVRNDQVATYGVRHRIEHRRLIRDQIAAGAANPCMTEAQIELLREMAVDLLTRNRGWRTGTVSYKFEVKQNSVLVSGCFAEPEDTIVD